ncbi:MAG TPA: Fic family protein [Dehalococcoidia bacterium]|nr:Fic family protein [Dehalococcoidia bacterium]
MNRKAFAAPAGRLVWTPGGYWAFVPERLSRQTSLDPDVIYLLSEADRHLGELAGMARVLPNPQLLIAPLSQREAVLSSRIEGTQASLSDLAVFEAAGRAIPGLSSDVVEVLNYRRAMSFGLERLAELPLSLRLVRELHAHLMSGVRGQEKAPGEFRSSQNWIGSPGSSLEEATYVPPPHTEMHDCLADWERFLHEETVTPPLIRCAQMHYQFEAIHPFLDGNGRVGRLLITLFLCTLGRLPSPALYLSPYFERHRTEYYDHLQAVSERSEWQNWFRFFARGVIIQSRDALARFDRLLKLYEDSRRQLLSFRAAPSVLRLLEALFTSPAVTVASAAATLGVTPVSATHAIDTLIERGILQEITGRRRDRVFLARTILRAIEDPTEVEREDANGPTLFKPGASP